MRISTLKRRLPRSMKKQVGASAIEYAVLAGLVAIVLVAVINPSTGSGGLKGALNTAFSSVTTAITTAMDDN